jgi:hypothetical protein
MKPIFYPVFTVILSMLASCEQPPEEVPYRPTGDVKHTMNLVLDPAADVIWGSAGFIMTEAGTQDLAPTTEEGWLALQHSAMVVAESGNLLMMPGRSKDNGDWQEISLALVDVGIRTQAAAEEKDADKVFDLGGELYRVCLSCHQLYIQGEEKANPLK